MGAELTLTVVDALARGTAVAQPQDEARVTYAGKLTKADGLLDWSQPAHVLHNRVRGLHPWPHAHSFLGGHRFVILRTQVVGHVVVTCDTGTILEAQGDDFLVAAGDGSALRVLQIQPEGKRPMTAREFLAGHRVRAGERFGDR
jgi:methionyl-tRNA formyltransferase